MLSKKGSILEVVVTRSEWAFLRIWGFSDLGLL